MEGAAGHDASVEPAAARRVVEESLGDAVIRGIDDFVFRDIEDEATALDVFSFVADPQIRTVLAASLRGARWQQKVGLVLARHKGHPAHVAQIRSQVIEYGAITELLLREVVRQERPRGLPATFKALIERAESGDHHRPGRTAGRRTGRAPIAGADAAGRNRVHHDADARPFKISDASAALRDVVQVVNQCRTGAGLGPWVPTKPAPQ